MKDYETFKKRKQEYFGLVNAQGLELIEIFNLYGNCEHFEHSICCKINLPVLLDFDIPRIAKFLHMSEEQFFKKYVHEYEIKGIDSRLERNFVLNEIPCPFLDNRNKCSIYPVRPFSCRFYPFQPALNELTLEGIDLCPTVTLMVSEVWEYTNLVYKNLPKGTLEKVQNEVKEYYDFREKMIDEIQKPLDEFSIKLGIQDITTQECNVTYRTIYFLEAMTYFDIY